MSALIDLAGETDQGHTDHNCGQAGKEFVSSQIKDAESLEYLAAGKDRYGRTLAYVFVNGELLQEKIVSRGLAHETVTFFGDNSYPDLADRIKNSAIEPHFQNPYLWRRAHSTRHLSK